MMFSILDVENILNNNSCSTTRLSRVIVYRTDEMRLIYLDGADIAHQAAGSTARHAQEQDWHQPDEIEGMAHGRGTESSILQPWNAVKSRSLGDMWTWCRAHLCFTLNSVTHFSSGVVHGNHFSRSMLLNLERRK